MTDLLSRLLASVGRGYRSLFPRSDAGLHDALRRSEARVYALKARLYRSELENRHLALSLVTVERLLAGVCAAAEGYPGADGPALRPADGRRLA